MSIKKEKILFFIITLLLSISYNIQAQELLWEKDLKEKLYKVSWIEQSNDGIIIAAGDKGLIGLDNTTGETLWEHKNLTAISRSTFQKIEGLHLFTIETNPTMEKLLNVSTRSLIINSSTGEIVFDSKEENLKFGDYHLLPQINSILFEAQQAPYNKLVLFNYETTQVSWLASLGEADKGVKGAFRNVYGLFSFLKDAPIIMDKARLLITERKKVHVLNYNSGEIIWSTSFKKPIKAATYSPIDQKVYVGIKEKLQVFDAASGEDVTSGKMKLGGSLVSIFSNNENNIIIVDSKGFNILNPASGKFLWKKPFGISGLYDVIDMKDYYLAIGSEEKSSAVAKVSRDGKKIWREKLDGYAYHVQPIDKGIFYLSTEKSNILTYEEGDKIWKKDIKFKAIPSVAVDTKNDEVVFFEGKELYRFNLNSGGIETLAEGIKLEKAKKAIFNLEARPNGYFLYSDQHTAFFDKNGKMSYSTYYKPVSSIGLESALQLTANVAGVDLDIAGTLETIKDLDALAHGSYSSAGDQNETSSKKSAVGGLYATTTTGQEIPLFEVTKTRFSNSRKAKDHNYILTNLNESSNIVMVNKETGAIDKKIKLTDKTPNYVTDEIDQRVFLNEKNRIVRCYKMN